MHRCRKRSRRPPGPPTPPPPGAVRLTTVADIRRVLSAHRPRLLSAGDRRRGAVALVLNERSADLRLLFVERAERREDPWSGHIAFPGGKIDLSDRDPRFAAERETREEIGLDPGSGEYLGRLDDLSGTILPVLVSGFVYAIEAPRAFRLNREIEAVFWIPISRLTDPERQVHYRFPQGDDDARLHPAVDLLGPGRPLLWGITYRFAAQLLQLTGREMPR